jgi:hypothetical protein
MRTAIAPEAVDAVRRRVADALAAARDDDVDDESRRRASR